MHVYVCSSSEQPVTFVNMYVQCVYCLIGKDYPIQASTKDEMIVWIKAIEDAAVSYHTHTCTSTKKEALFLHC